MSTPTILVSPIGYDNVGAVLQRLGGSLATTHQLEDTDVLKLRDAAFLSNFQHLFLNCHRMFDDPLDPGIVSAVRDFVNNGGALYASDWASTVVGAAFGGLSAFSKKQGRVGVVQARVSDPYLVQNLGRNISINFDMDGWVLIDKFPASADVYLWDMNRKQLAVGFRAGRGRIVFTSFHHHAQQQNLQSAAEETLLQWLVTLPTQHRHLLSVDMQLAQYRATGGSQVVSRIGNNPQVIPLNLGPKSGLGVFALSWDHDDRVEFSMRFLRRREIAESEKKSSHPPLVMTVRNPKNEDAIEVRRRVLGNSHEEVDHTQPYVFAASIRRDLLGDPDWFASTIARRLLASLKGEPTLGMAQEHFTTERVQGVIETILVGLGYVASLYHREEQENGWTEIRASPEGIESEVPAIQIEVKMLGRTIRLGETNDSNAAQSSELLQFYPIRGELIPGAERLLVYLAFSRGATEESPSSEEGLRIVGSSSESTVWRMIASESMILGRGQEVVSAQEFSETDQINIMVYRAEEGISQS